jgi:hypothetical protein
MTQARVAVSGSPLEPEPEVPDAHPASSNAVADAATDIEINEGVFTSLPFCREGGHSLMTTVVIGCGSEIICLFDG